jgi:hypothetical protein
MGYGIANTSTDFRLLDCKHDRLRQALEFRPAGWSPAPAVAAAPAVVAPAPAAELELDFDLERSTPSGFMAGAVSTVALALIWFMLVCMTNMDYSDLQNDAAAPHIVSQTQSVNA